jgi:presenilin-like A22 family membrane protease
MVAIRIIEKRQTLQIICAFLIVQFLGILLATQVYNGAMYQKITRAATLPPASTPSILSIAVSYAIVIAAFVILYIFLRRGYASPLRIFEWIIILISFYLLFGILISIPFGLAQTFLFGNIPVIIPITAFLLAILVIFIKSKIPSIRNIVTILSSVGIGLGVGFGFWQTVFALLAIFGSHLAVIGLGLGSIILLLFLGLFGIYDLVAVFVTKHMVTLADAAMNMNLAFMVTVSEVAEVPKSSLSKSELKQYQALQKKMQKNKLFSENSKFARIPAGLSLGNGDMALPLAVAIASYALYGSFVIVLFIAIGAMFGLLLTVYILRKYRRPLPAIPMLFAGVLAAMILYYIMFVSLAL